MAQQNKASILPEARGALVVGNRAIPSPQGNEALVKVTAAGVLGIDGAGIIEAVGPEVTGFKAGDRVFFQGEYQPDAATFQQYALANTEFASKIPENISDDQASTIPVTAFTAVLGLFQKTGVQFPETGPTANGRGVVILGGSSSVGQYGELALSRCVASFTNPPASAIQFARIAGFSPIVTTSSDRHAKYLKSLGATHVFDRDVDANTIQAAFTTPVALVLDSISAASTQSFAFDVLTTPAAVPNAHLAVLLPPDESIASKNTDGTVLVHPVLSDPKLSKELSIPLWRVVGRWTEEGKLVPHRVQVVPGGLAGVSEGLDLSRAGVSGVKLVVHPQE